MTIPSYVFSNTSQTLELSNPTEQIIHFELYNSMGQVITQRNLASFSKQTIQLPNLKSGMYIMKMGNEQGEFQVRKTIIP